MSNRRRITRGQRRQKKQSPSLGLYKRSVIVVTMALILLVCVLTVNAMNLQAKNKNLKQQEEELEVQLNNQKNRAKDIRKYEEYVKTDEYIKRVAEEKLGLVDPNEIIFKSAK